MANFKFNKAQFSSQTADWNYESVGTLGKNSKGRKIKFTKRNLASDSRVVILISDASGSFDDADILICTAPLSQMIRKGLAKGTTQKQMLAICSKLEIQVDKDDETKYFLFQPQGDGEMLPSFAVNELAKETVSYDDLVAF